MKILTGKLKGKTIQFKPNPELRPTADKVRQALFNMLQGAVEGKNVLDLFSGTGALGIEALSQGAAYVTFVDLDGTRAKNLKENLETLGIKSEAQVIQADAIQTITDLSLQGAYFDFIFLDPPYQEGLGHKALAVLATSKVLNEDTIIILESHKREDFPDSIGNLSKFREKRYSDTKISFYKMLVVA